jgi:hypothetical protein
MAHNQQREFFLRIKEKFPEYFNDVSVIEIGSLNINGTIRDFYNSNKYIGIDLQAGPGVDMILEGQNVKLPDNSFDVAASAECFEHNPFWKETFLNMYRMASKFVIITCASDGRGEHGTTRTSPQDSPFTLEWDYYKNLNEQDFKNEFNLDLMFSEYEFSYNANSCDLYFWGVKDNNATI